MYSIRLPYKAIAVRPFKPRRRLGVWMTPLLMQTKGARLRYHKKYYSVHTLLKVTKAHVCRSMAKNTS